MKHPLATVLALSLGTATLWMVTLAQLPGGYTFPDHSTRTEMPGP
jgi:hypothetical protein